MADDRELLGLVGVAHALVHTYELSLPILVPVWLEAFTTTPATVGLVVTAGYALFGAGALPGGIAVDRFGSRRLITGCLLGMGLSFVLLAVSPGIVGVTLALICWGVAASVYHPAGLSLISTTAESQGRVFAYHGMAGNLGIAVGPLATALLLAVADWRTVVAVLAVPAFVGALFASRLTVAENGGDRATTLTTLRADTRRLFTGAFVLVFGVVVASGLYYRGLLTFLPTVLEAAEGFQAVTIAGTSVDPARLAYVGLLGAGMAGQYASGRLTDHVRPERAIVAVFAALALLAPFVVPAVGAGPLAFGAVAAVLGVVLFAAQPLYQATVASVTPEDARGVSYGFTYLGVFGVGALGGAAAGAALTYYSPGALFVALAVVAVGGTAFAATLVYRT